MKKWTVLMIVSMLAVSLLSGCGSNTDNSNNDGNVSGSGNKKVELQFFQYKPEGRDTFDKLIAKFEEKYPNIKVVQDNPPDSSTVLKAKVAANEIPDIIANGGDNVYATLAQSGVLADLTDAPELQNITLRF